MQLITDKAAFAAEFIDIEKAAGLADIQWEPFQLEYLNNRSRFAIDVKSRQIAWSFTAALDAVVDGILNDEIPHVFVSINKEEAQEKIRYAKAIVEAIDAPVRPKLIKDSSTAIEFDNGSRCISHPCRPPRGKPKARIYLDEMAHYPDGLDRQIYTAALPATTKGDGYIRIGSSPLGAKGLFWEIVTESMKKWPGYTRRFLPWWKIKALCKDTKMAAQIAPEMLTEERVRAFGTQALIEIFENMFLEDFQQEYECAWIDEATAWITWEMIKRNQDKDLVWFHARGIDEALAMIGEVQDAIRIGTIEHTLAGGIDVGRVKDLSELTLVGNSPLGDKPVRFCVSLDNVPLDDQERCFGEIISRLPITYLLIDRNGIGRQLAEDLENLTGIAEGFDFTNESKELLAIEARLQAERGKAPLPYDRELAYQIHSIKKTVTAAKHNRYDTERNQKHHADKFWSWALALYASGGGMENTLRFGSSPVAGYRG